MKKFTLILAALGLALIGSGCSSRAVTNDEKVFLATVFGDSVDVDSVSIRSSGVAKGIEEGIELGDIPPAYATSGQHTESWFDADAITIRNRIYFNAAIYLDNYYDPNEIHLLIDLFAHEFVHVWQWQNREKTGYSLSRVIQEHVTYGKAVYEYERPPSQPFLQYRYEQQGMIVQDYIFMREHSPQHPWLPIYEKVIRVAIPLTKLQRAIEEFCQKTPSDSCKSLVHPVPPAS